MTAYGMVMNESRCVERGHWSREHRWRPGLGIYYFFTTGLLVDTKVSDNKLIKPAAPIGSAPSDAEAVIIQMTMHEAKGKENTTVNLYH